MSSRNGQAFSRVLFFGKNKHNTCCTQNMVQAIQATGRQVRWLNPPLLARWLGKEQAKRRMWQAIEDFQPDFVFVFFRDVPIDILNRLAPHVPTVFWVEEFVDPIPEDVKERTSQSSLVALTNLSQIEDFKATGASNVEFFLSACGPTHYRRPFDPAANGGPDVLFIGGPGSLGQRVEVLSLLSKYFKVEIFGRDWDKVSHELNGAKVHKSIGPRKFVKACQHASIVLGMNDRNDIPLYFSNRIWLTMASGGFHLTHFVPRMDEIFQAGKQLDWFENPGECLEKVDYYLKHHDERNEIAVEGRKFVLQSHTYEHRIRQVIDSLLKQRETSGNEPIRVIPSMKHGESVLSEVAS